MRKCTALLVVVILSACMAGCRSEALRVESIQLGRSINPDSTVSSFTTRFVPGETVYLSVGTSGSGSATLSVRWLYEGRVIDEPKKQVSYKVAAATEFRLQSVTGFPTGGYIAEVFLNGQSVGTRPFRVEKQR